MVKEIIVGENLINHIKEYDVILVGTSIKNCFGNGFQYDIGLNFPDVLKVNRKTKYDDPNKLGTCEVVTSYQKKGFPLFVICYITKGRYRPDIQPDALDYNALTNCLELVNKHFKGKKIGTTLIGNSNYEAGGNAKKIYDIIADTCDDVDLYIYDFEQENYKEKIRNTFVNIVKDYKTNNITLEEYQDRMKKFCWEKSFGIYTPMPDMSLTEIRNEIKRLKYND